MRNTNERVVYVAPTVKPGDSIQWGSWADRPESVHWFTEHDRSDYPGMSSVRSHFGGGIQLTIIELATGSDYSGCLVEQSNFRVLQKAYPWLVEIYGSHGTFGLGYLGKRANQNPRLLESLDSLALYPLADEDDHSELEHETADEAWVEYGRDDFKSALVKYFDELYAPDEHDLDEIDSERIDNLWYDCTERFRGGEAYLNEQGDSIHFPIDSVMRDIRAERAGFLKPHYSGERPSICEQLVSIATDATISEENDNV